MVERDVDASVAQPRESLARVPCRSESQRSTFNTSALLWIHSARPSVQSCILARILKRNRPDCSLLLNQRLDDSTPKAPVAQVVHEQLDPHDTRIFLSYSHRHQYQPPSTTLGRYGAFQGFVLAVKQ